MQFYFFGDFQTFEQANRASRLSRICEVHINNENFALPSGYEGHSPSVSDVADFKSETSWFS